MHRAIRAGLTVGAILVFALVRGDADRSAAVAQDTPAPNVRTLRTWTRLDDWPVIAHLPARASDRLGTLGAFGTKVIQVGDDVRLPDATVLVVATEATLAGGRVTEARDFVARGGVVFVDEWGGDASWLASLDPGGTVRELTGADAVLHRPSGMPARRASESPALFGVERSGEIRVIASRERTLCRDEAPAGDPALGETVVRHAWDVALRTRPEPVRPVRIRRTELTGRRLLASGEVRAPAGRLMSLARLRLLRLDGTVAAEVSSVVKAGTTDVLALNTDVAVPFDVLDHRLELVREDEVSVDRCVEPLLRSVGATEVLVGHTGSVVQGAPASVRVLVRNSATGTPVADCPVTLSLRRGDEPTNAIAGITDAAGTVSLAEDIPAEAPDAPAAGASLTWAVAAQTPLFAEECRTSTRLSEVCSGHILPDLPVHRPGDVVRFRLLAVRQPSGRPVAGRAIVVALDSLRSGTAAKVQVTTDAHGVASSELRVPADAETGDYELVAWGLGRAPIRVESFETPRFKLTLDGVARMATPGGSLSGTVAAARFDGSTIPGAAVSVRLRTDDIASAPLARWEGSTGRDGRVAFDLTVPADAPTGRGAFLDVAAVDAGGRTVREAVPVAWRRETSVLQVHGSLVAGHPGTLLVRTGLAPSTAVVTRVGDGPAHGAIVDDLGFVEVAVPRAAETNTITVAGETRTVCASPSRLDVAPRVVAQGAPVRVRFTTSSVASAVLVDVLWRGTLVATHTLLVADGQAAADISLPDRLTGPVTFHLTTGTDTIEDAEESETVFVVPRESLRVEMTPRPADVHPGETVNLGLRVTDPLGAPRPAVVAVRVVDEAVLSLVTEPIDVARVSLAAGGARRRWTSGPALIDLAATAARRPLSTGEARLATTAESEWRTRTRLRWGESSLADRRRRHLRVVDAAFEVWGASFVRRAADAIASGAAPGPSDTVPDVASALRIAAAGGAFGPDGLLDPWGTPVVIRDLRPLPFSSRGEDILDRGGPFRPILLRSAGPDGERNDGGTWNDDSLEPSEVRPIDEGSRSDALCIDDTRHALSMRSTLALHAAWLRAGGRSFDVDEFLGCADWRECHPRRVTGWLSASGGSGMAQAAQEPEEARVRSFFPDAILFAPLVMTDADGRAQVPLTAPDSVTTWRADAVAHDDAGGVGQSDARFRTTLPFTADADVPPSLVAGDEVEIPVWFRWTAAERLDVETDVEVSGPIERLSTRQLRVGPGARGEAAAFVRVRATGRGTARIVVRCTSGEARDAVAREFDVVPGGFPRSVPGTFRSAAGAATATLRVPPNAVPGSVRAEIRLRTSPLDDLRDGLAGLLQQPHGCFEQASSAMFPNVLALSALGDSPALTPALAASFERAIREGTDLLLKYEIPGGGFDWFGRPPAKLLLSAYGAHEWWMLHRLRRSRGLEDGNGTDGAGAVAMRTSRWLVSQQREDGSFPADGVPYEWRGTQSGELAATAYVGWALTQGRRWDPSFEQAVVRAREWVKPRAAACSDSYTLALAALFLAESGDTATAGEVAARLRTKLVRADGLAWLDGGAGSALHGRGDFAGTEATALAAMAAARLVSADALPRDELLAALAARRRPDGTWGTTQATILALWALVDSKDPPIPPGTEFRIRAEGMPDRVVALDDTPGAVRVDVSGLVSRPVPATVTVERTDGGPVAGALVVSYEVAWSVEPPDPGPRPISVTRTLPATARAGAPFEIGVTVAANGDRPVAMPVVVVPLPAGVLVDAAVLRLRPLPEGVERIESDPERVTLYLRWLDPGQRVEASVPVTPRLRGRITAAPAEARPYYEPDTVTRTGPATLDVE